MLAAIYVFLLVAPAAHASAALSKITLRLRDGGHRVMVDNFGRERQFHGTNVIVKGSPWLPARDAFDPRNSLVAYDFELMQAAGMNVIRLGVMWPGVEPVRGQYNETYLQIMTEIAAEAATYGIYTLADMHQDALSERFCGEGIPRWASQPNDIVPFPLPFSRKPFGTSWNGFPTRQECSTVSWSEVQFAPAATSAYQRLYDNSHDGLTDSWGKFWAKVASAFGGAPELLGLELINEPNIGNPWTNPTRMIPDVGERVLQRAYDRLMEHIRPVAQDALVFFAGPTWMRTGNWFVDALPLGFTHAPGGAEYANRSVSAFHYYEGPQEKGRTAEYIAQQLRDAQKLQTGLFLTETGGGSSKEFANWTSFEHAAPSAEAKGVSWAIHGWKQYCTETAESLNSSSQEAAFGACKTGVSTGPWTADGKVDPSLLVRQSRPYVPAIAGNFSSHHYNDTTRTMTFSFLMDSTIPAPTVVSLPTIIYPQGYDITVDPRGAVLVGEKSAASPLVDLTPGTATAFGMTVTITVTPKARHSL
ncbi:hypothetical protein CYMTET_6190 [Cymbomonas tetramitiformis]|uniref:Endoglycoceramidase n=1 Tax=Cymbomonas tetramitiformis TaxID=36881 RepID=A0AAE0GXX3_9CHLO|nr:hypothetical protein CYMTET_6190 [Cymbomonas tetramitiformis]|eukprot:gene25087-30613_t